MIKIFAHRGQKSFRTVREAGPYNTDMEISIVYLVGAVQCAARNLPSQGFLDQTHRVFDNRFGRGTAPPLRFSGYVRGDAAKIDGMCQKGSAKTGHKRQNKDNKKGIFGKLTAFLTHDAVLHMPDLL